MKTERQQELLTFIETYQTERGGISPTFDEMADALGLKSKSGISRMIVALEERGQIRRLPYRARAIEILRKGADACAGGVAADPGVAILTEQEEKALKAAHRALAAVMPLHEGTFDDGSYARVAVALSGLCQGIQEGAYGPPNDELVGDLAALQQTYFDVGAFRAAEVVGAA